MVFRLPSTKDIFNEIDINKMLIFSLIMYNPLHVSIILDQEYMQVIIALRS
jgi:hypothetical protein